MLADWRAQSLAEDFAGQWLQLRDGDRRRWTRGPDFKYGIASGMKKESQTFFNHLLSENRPVIEFTLRGLHLPEREAGPAITTSRA